ncbi:MAG: hypothetical protein K9N46_10900 [Candidatus Marinimicrobia bacterium]|nr:hypothetical protein [Candidatus Neomarinimicrobiota bacterium]MCF7827711.1 hypothetical protein [Candidatus Neomarinimicrobiota bacterium]MCF7881234.1 hypothetical protein [Candidatus Neomarinimicrobiota bacterium]
MAGQTHLSSDWHLGNITTPDFRGEIHEILQIVKNDLHFPDRILSIVLPPEWIHSYIAHVDTALPPDRQREFLHWEAKKRIGSQYERLETRLYPMRTSDGIEEILSVNLPEKLLQNLKAAADEIHLTIESAELSAVSASSNIPQANEMRYLARFTTDTVEITQFSNGVIEGAGLYRLQPDESPQLLRCSGGMSVAQEFRAVLSAVLSGESMGSIPVHVYGLDIPEAIHFAVESETGYSYLPSFSGFHVNFRDEADLAGESKYAEVAGAIRQAVAGTL